MVIVQNTVRLATRAERVTAAATKMAARLGPRAEQEEMKGKLSSKAFFPMTMPVTAGPGSIAVTLTLVPAGSLLSSGTWVKFAGAAAGIALASLSVFLFYRYSENLLRRVGHAGTQTISKISAFILLTIGVQIIWEGIRGLAGI